MNRRHGTHMLVAALGALVSFGCSERGQGQTGFGGASSSATSAQGGAGGMGTGAGTSVAVTSGVGGAYEFDLVDRGVVVRYYLDEADTGIDAMSMARDATPDPLDVPMTGDLQLAAYSYDEDPGGNRGLRWINADSSGGPSVAVADTKLQQRLHQASGATIEVVYDADAVSQSGSRLMHIGYEWSGGWFSLSARSPQRVQVFANDGPRLAEFPVPGPGRIVVHVVYDSDQEDPEDRVRGYVNGSRVARLGGAPPIQGLLLDMVPEAPTVLTFDIGHRAYGERSVEGMVYYGAYYDEALTHHEIIQNASVLLESDDAP